ncbi:MAG: hypothetical protein H0U76_23605 [Ktedonobacteraceae bacterium]|nr:hypothetical protein [Ktedonobacteraceae bacterium]
MQHSMYDRAGPAYPLAPGARVPELNLAGVDGLNVASGESMQYTPDPIAPAPVTFSLQGSPDLGGIDPQAPIPELNLAGVEGVPSPLQVVRAESVSIHQPDFGTPDFAQAELRPYDLTEPGITQTQNPLFATDPLLPALNEYRRPYGLTFHNQTANETLKPDPLLNDLLHYEVPEGVEVRRDVQGPDPLLPDLQHPQLTQNVHMQQRPGDLDANALQQVNRDPSYQELSDVPYAQVFIDQAGMNTARRRHYDLLLSQYHKEEKL